MNKFYTLFLGVLLASPAFSQTFSDDFESYTSGDLIAESSADWDTWTGSPGSPEDAEISDVQANSGTNSLYFQTSNTNGGPTDIVLPFGGYYEGGLFSLEMYIYVDADNGGYFNLQGGEDTAEDWAMDVFIFQDGTIKVFSDNASIEQLNGTYTQETWVKINVDIDLDENNWEVSIDDVSLGSFSNGINSVSSLNLFPWNSTSEGGNDMSSFYIDDISYDASAATSVSERNSPEFRIFPNPASEKINFDGEISSINKIDILDMNGRVVTSSAFTMNSSPAFDISNLESGAYMIIIDTDRGICTERILIQ